jgi:hypothetical protein
MKVTQLMQVMRQEPLTSITYVTSITFITH